MAQHIVTVNNAFPRSSSSVKNPYAFLHDLTSILKEPSITFRISAPKPNVGKQESSLSEFHVKVPPQNVQKISDALSKAEALQKEVEATANTDIVQSLKQTNKDISYWISQELPAIVLLALIEDYCREHSKVLAQTAQHRRERIRSGERITMSCLLVGAVYTAFTSIFFLIIYPSSILFLLTVIPGLFLEGAGLWRLKDNTGQRKKLNEIMQQQNALHQFRMLPLIIEAMTDETKKRAIMQQLLMSILAYENTYQDEF